MTDEPYLPGFVPSAADRYYGAAISKLLRENEALRLANDTLAGEVNALRAEKEELMIAKLGLTVQVARDEEGYPIE